MDAQDFRSLQEAYLEVYQEIDESIKNPESRKKLRSIMDKEVRKGDKSKGENPRSKYSTEKGNQAFHLLVGRDETGSKGNPVRKRGGTNAPADERVGRGPHRAANAAHWAANAGPTRDRGAGNKAARRAGKNVPNTRDVDESIDIYDIILSHLLDEGYADTQESAEAIMVNMSEEWRDSIVEGEEDYKPLPRRKMINKANRLRKSGDVEKRSRSADIEYQLRAHSPEASKTSSYVNRAYGRGSL
jgi:hypothetical protein